MTENPYQAPVSLEPQPDAPTDPGSIRRKHINHESSIRSIGLLYYLGAGIWGLISLTPLSFISRLPNDQVVTGSTVSQLFIFFLICAALATLMFFTGRGLRTLAGWGRGLGFILAILGLIAIPIGTILSLYLLYLLISKKGHMVFSPEYQEIIAATPDIKSRTSLVVWVIFGLVILLLALAWFSPPI